MTNQEAIDIIKTAIAEVELGVISFVRVDKPAGWGD